MKKNCYQCGFSYRRLFCDLAFYLDAESVSET